MATWTFINCTGADYYQVHRAGCRDIAKVRKNGQWDVTAETLDGAISRELESVRDLGFHASDFRVLPCAEEIGDRGGLAASRRPRKAGRSDPNIPREFLRALGTRCPDCGERAAQAGHQTCPYPQDHR